jgi:hypothetical protein
MAILVCLLNLVIWAMIILFVLWIVTVVLSMFIPGVPTLVPFPGQPAAGGGRVLSLLYLAIGLILLINFLICAIGGGHTLLPPIWTGGMEMR